jgi:hypothetical protein
MFFEVFSEPRSGIEKSNNKVDADLKDSDYIVVTVIVWSFLCFNWTQKTIKAFRRAKEGEVLNISSL